MAFGVSAMEEEEEGEESEEGYCAAYDAACYGACVGFLGSG
jgi:hypothetical protein